MSHLQQKAFDGLYFYRKCFYIRGIELRYSWINPNASPTYDGSHFSIFRQSIQSEPREHELNFIFISIWRWTKLLSNFCNNWWKSIENIMLWKLLNNTSIHLLIQRKMQSNTTPNWILKIKLSYIKNWKSNRIRFFKVNQYADR